MSISELVGSAKTMSDLEVRPHILRYQESTTVNAGQYFRMSMPRVSNDCLDMSSIRMKFRFTVTSTDAGVCVDGSDIRTIFSRVRALSGSTVLFDLSEAAQCFQLETHRKSSSNSSLYEKYLTGNSEDLATRQLWADAPRNYTCSIAPEGTLLNSNACLPLSMMNDLHLEFWLATGAQVLYSPANDGASTFSLSDIEILSDYIRSRSISSYFQSNGVRFHVTDISHRFGNVISQQNLIRLSSAHSSLNKTLTVLRPTTQPGDIDVQNRLSSYYSGANFASLNVFINGSLYFEEDVISVEELWHQLHKAFGEVHTSDWFNTLFNTTRNVVAVNLQAAPEFEKTLSSGVKTAALNSDVVLRVNFTGVPASALRSDTFLFSDALVSLEQRGGDLKISY